MTIAIRRAAFRRLLDRGGRRYAEVEVETDLAGYPQLLAYFRVEGSGRYQLVRVMDGHPESAHEEAGASDAPDGGLSGLLFAGPSHGSTEDRVQFGRRLLECGDLRSQLDSHLKAEGGVST